MRYGGWGATQLEKEASALLARYKAELGRQEVKQLNIELAEAEAAGDEEKQAEILRKIMTLRKS